jgi:hypothetical protein
MGRREIHAEFSMANLKETAHMDNSGVDRRGIIKWILLK